MVGIVARWVQDRYAYQAAGIYYGAQMVSSSALQKSSKCLNSWLGCHRGKERTVRVEDLAQELHARRCERIVFGKLEFGRKHTAFEWCAFRSLDECLPMQEVIFGHGTGSDAIRWVIGERAVLLKKPAVGC